MKKYFSRRNGIVGIGVDIEDVSHFIKRPFKKYEGFYRKIFTQKEIEYCLERPNPPQHFAVRFCAKEAFIKAVNEKIIDYRSIEVVIFKNKPTIRWKKHNILLSLAHEKNRAIAYVVVTKNEEDTHKRQLLEPNINKVIEGRTIVLKPVTRKEITRKYLSWLNNPEINKFLEVRHQKQTFTSIIRYINSVRSRPGCEVFAIFTKNENIHIGTLSITDNDPYNKLVCYGLMIGDRSAQMRGAGGETAVLIIEYLFRHLGVRKIFGKVIAGNQRSWKSCESLGFQREGILREQSLFESGKVDDQYAYGLLKREWGLLQKKVSGLLQDMKVYPFISHSRQ